MEYKSLFWGVKVRPAIIKEFTYSSGKIDDMMAGLHEIRARSREKSKDKSRANVKFIPRNVRV